MNRPLLRLLGLAAFAGLLAQAGHLLVYQLQFGATAVAVQSQGSHGYFPTLAKTGLGVAAAALVACLLLLGVARLLPGRRVIITRRGPTYLTMLSGLFTIQVAFFIGQEAIEAIVAGTTARSLLTLFLVGSAGQLPVAVCAALALRWLTVRIDAALLMLRAELAVRPAESRPIALLVRVPALVLAPALAESCPAAYVKRAPPAILRA